MVGTGLQLRQALTTQPCEPDETALATSLLRYTGRGTTDFYNWNDGRLCVDYSPRHDALSALRQLQLARYGRLHAAALFLAPAVGEDILLNVDGAPIQTRDFGGLLTPTDAIGDVVDMRWHGHERVSFECKVREYPMPDAQARAFRRLCDVIVFNYPGILSSPGPPQDMCTRHATLDISQLERGTENRCPTLWWSPVEGIRVSVGSVASTRDATAAGRHLTGDARLQFFPHVWLDDVATPWHSLARSPRTHARDHLQIQMRARGEAEIDERRLRWVLSNASIANALNSISWEEILKIQGAPATHRLQFYRIKGARVTGWSPAYQAVVCPHCPGIGADGGKASHIFWECPYAQQLWERLRQRWRPLWTSVSQPDAAAFLRDVFSLRLSRMPSRLWDQSELTRLPQLTAADTSATHHAMQAAWRLQALATFHTIWKWRTDADAPTDIWTPVQAQAYLCGCLNATLTDLKWPRTPTSVASRHTTAAIAVLRTCDSDDAIQAATQTPTTDDQYILFFDGGSRGNPGPGESGAVNVKTSHRATQASVIWSAAMSAAQPTTTNNTAEYGGAITGLRAAQAQRWTPLDVVGDSQFILRQLRDYSAPKKRHLRELYAEARRLGDKLGVQRWIHHLRAHNKMADAAANAAMDTRSSSQAFHPTDR